MFWKVTLGIEAVVLALFVYLIWYMVHHQSGSWDVDGPICSVLQIFAAGWVLLSLAFNAIAYFVRWVMK